MEAYRGQNLATQMREIRQMFAEQEKTGLNTRCFLSVVRCGCVILSSCEHATIKPLTFTNLRQERREHHSNL